MKSHLRSQQLQSLKAASLEGVKLCIGNPNHISFCNSTTTAYITCVVIQVCHEVFLLCSIHLLTVQLLVTKHADLCYALFCMFNLSVYLTYPEVEGRKFLESIKET